MADPSHSSRPGSKGPRPESPNSRPASPKVNTSLNEDDGHGRGRPTSRDRSRGGSPRRPEDLDARISAWDYNLNPLRAYYYMTGKFSALWASIAASCATALLFVRKTAAFGFLIATIILAFLGTNFFCLWGPSSTCSWTKELSALTDVETEQIGGLVNSTRHGTNRAMDLITTRRALEELHEVGCNLPADLDGELQRYHVTLLQVARRIMRVDAGIWALAETVIVLNEATHKYLEQSSQQSSWSRMWWYYCTDPSFETTSRAFNNLRDALTGAMDAALREATALRTDAQRLYQVAAKSRRLSREFLGKKRDRGEKLDADVLALLWDEIVPWRRPDDYKASIRRPLATAHITLQKASDYIESVFKDLQQTKQRIQLIEDLSSHSFWDSFFRKSSCASSWDGDEQTVFKDLIVAAEDLRTLLRNRP